MSFDIRIEGLDELSKEIKKAKEGLSLEYLTSFCNRISNDVRLRAPEKLTESFTFNVKLSKEGNPQLELDCTEELGGILIDAIKEHLNEMPITTRAFFEQVIDVIEGEFESG